MAAKAKNHKKRKKQKRDRRAKKNKKRQRIHDQSVILMSIIEASRAQKKSIFNLRHVKDLSLYQKEGNQDGCYPT